MIWKRSAVLRFYSVCGLLLQGNPRPAAGSINFTPIPHHPYSTPYFHSPPSSPSVPRDFHPLPQLLGAAGGSGSLLQPPNLQRWLSPALPAGSPLSGTFCLFIHLSFLHLLLSTPANPPALHAFWLATCAFSEHPPSSHLPHHAPDRPSSSL